MEIAMENKIIDEIYKAMTHLGAGPELLCIIGSYKDTLPDGDVLAELKAWNGNKEIDPSDN